MPSHRRRTNYFSLATKPRRALLRGLMSSLVEHGRIKTTVLKAKEVRRHIEKAITLGKKGDLNTTRLLLSRIPNKAVVQTIVKDLSVRFKSRPGGYTRIIKIGRRPGDTAEMAFLEFVDYDYTKVGQEPTETKATKGDGEKATKGKKKTVAAAAAKVKRTAVRAAAARKKSAKKMQKKSRAVSAARA